MTLRHPPPADHPIVRVYRGLTAAYPPAFRVMFADSMAADLNDALHDVDRPGHRTDVALLVLRVAGDLVWSVMAQWLRTSVPWLTLAYSTALVCFCEALASAFMGGPFRWPLVAGLLPLVAGITFTCWFVVPHVRLRRSRPPCLTSAG